MKSLVMCLLLQIDLDTIDVSNLNRQFLFHKEHIGKSKAQVAKDSALSFNPNVNIVAHHDSVIRLVVVRTYYFRMANMCKQSRSAVSVEWKI